MRITPEGRLTGVSQCPSPNQDARLDPQDISLLVVHGISLPPGRFGGPHVRELFCNALDPAAHPFFAEICELRVSAHLFIRRDGRMIQFVPFSRRAWHAGQSVFDGRERCNDFSVGIELEGRDDCRYTGSQYRQLSRVTRLLLRVYPGITPERIAGHSDIAPGRKTDPGPHFDWHRFHAALAGSRA